MSDQRPEWMPDDDKIRACAAIDHVDSAHTKLYSVHSTMTLMHATGLRAQIAALEWAQGQLHMGLAINAEIERLRKELEG